MQGSVSTKNSNLWSVPDFSKMYVFDLFSICAYRIRGWAKNPINFVIKLQSPTKLLARFIHWNKNVYRMHKILMIVCPHSWYILLFTHIFQHTKCVFLRISAKKNLELFYHFYKGCQIFVGTL